MMTQRRGRVKSPLAPSSRRAPRLILSLRRHRAKILRLGATLAGRTVGISPGSNRRGRRPHRLASVPCARRVLSGRSFPMRVRWFPALALLGLLVAALPARAGDKPATAPVAVVRFASIDTVFDNAKFIAKLVGKEEIGRQLEGILKAKTGPKGLEGIDPRRPLGVYPKMGSDLSDAAGGG